MQIADNVLKHHLQNVYFVSGGTCGGKTTVTKYLAKTYDMVLYNWDEKYAEFQSLADPIEQPAFSQRTEFTSWEEYFMRPVEEYSDWLKACFREQTGMVLADLLITVGRDKDKKVIVDGFFTVEELKKISDYTRVVFLLATQDVVRNDYFSREEKKDMLDCIMGLKDPQAALENVFRTMEYESDQFEKNVFESGFKFFVRETLGGEPSTRIAEIEKHFGLV